MRRRWIYIWLGLVLLVGGWYLWRGEDQMNQETRMAEDENGAGFEVGRAAIDAENPLSIESLRSGSYTGSEIREVEKIESEQRYHKSIVAHESEGKTIYALLGIPKGTPPEGGWPVIIFNHGYIAPAVYRTNERYVAYFDRLVMAGYAVVKSDYRGHGESEGEATGAYGSDGYVRDVWELLASIKRHPGINPTKIGMWGHSMGGHITLRIMVSNPEVKVGVIWAGVVASYPDLLTNWRRRSPNPLPSPSARRWRESLQERYGTPEANPEFWNGISATSYLAEISGPVQLHHGTDDTSVPVEFSRMLEEKMKSVGKEAELYVYTGDDHNLTHNFGIAMERTIDYFDRHLR